MSLKIYTTHRVEPAKIYYKKKTYFITYFDPRFLITKFAIKLGRENRILGARLYDCFHPNATDKFELERRGQRRKRGTPHELDYCLAPALKGEVFGDKVTVWDFLMCFSIWNLDASYYLPKPGYHVKCKPKWYPDQNHLREIKRIHRNGGIAIR